MSSDTTRQRPAWSKLDQMDLEHVVGDLPDDCGDDLAKTCVTIGDLMAARRQPHKHLPAAKTHEQIHRRIVFDAKKAKVDPSAYLASLIHDRKKGKTPVQNEGKAPVQTEAQTAKDQAVPASRSSSPLSDPGSDATTREPPALPQPQADKVRPLSGYLNSGRTRAPLELTSDERTMVENWRSFTEIQGYQMPPPHEDVVLRMSMIMDEIDRGIIAFAKSQSIAQMNFSSLTADSHALCRLMTMKHRELDLKLLMQTLNGEPYVDHAVFLRAFAAAALREWVFEQFECGPKSAFQEPIYERISSFDRELPQLKEKVVVVDRVQYLLNTVLPGTRYLAGGYQERLRSVFSNITEKTWNQPSQYLSQNFDFRYAQEKQMTDSLNAAFHLALELKATVEACQRQYLFQAPVLGDNFDSKWMTVPHRDRNEMPANSKVCMCLQPAVFSQNRRMRRADRHLIVPAVVMVQGYPVNWRIAESILPNEGGLVSNTV